MNSRAFTHLTPEMVAEIEAFAPRYPSRQAVTLPALHVVYERLRHVPFGAVAEIAELLGLAPAEVQDTLSFYQFFPQEKPCGRVRAFVCRSISCSLRGGEELLAGLCDAAGIEPGGTTADGGLTIEPAECLGGCDHAPCLLAAGRLHEKLDPAEAGAVLETLRQAAGPEPSVAG